MPRPQPSRHLGTRHVAAASSAVLALALAGCSAGPVEVTEHTPVPGTDSVCSALLRALPAAVDGEQRREVEPADALAAAWGDPAIVLRCGVPQPDGLDEFATCQETDGVGWYVPEDQLTGAPLPLAMTTVDRAVYVEVRLPEEHWPPANTMVDLAEAIRDVVPQTSPCV